MNLKTKTLAIYFLLLILLILLLLILQTHVTHHPTGPIHKTESLNQKNQLNKNYDTELKEENYELKENLKNNYSDSKGVAVIVEWRPCHQFVSTIFNAIQNLPKNWIIQVFHSRQNYGFLSKHPKLMPLFQSGKLQYTLIPDDYNSLSIHSQSMRSIYNRLLTSYWFWEKVLDENCLIFQLDTRFCSNSPHKIEDYLEYSYVGAPWYHHECWGGIVGVGNGGLSFRKKSIMIKVLEQRGEAKKKILEDPYLWPCRELDYAEDAIFSFGVYYMVNYLHMPGVSYPSTDIAATFAQENFYLFGTPPAYLPSFGVHQANRYSGDLLKWCPEIIEARSGCDQVPDYEVEWDRADKGDKKGKIMA